MGIKTLKIVGLRILQKIQSVDEDMGVSHPEVCQQYEIGLIEHGSRKKYILHGWTEHGMCSSGYTTATWGYVDLKPVKNFGSMTHKWIGKSEPTGWDPDADIEDGVHPGNGLIRLDVEKPSDFKCEEFGWQYDGGDGYYPRGGFSVNLEYFQQVSLRGRTKPLIYLLVGGSNLGKSTLAGHLKDLEVYETDQAEEFDKKMAYADVIVVGNKHGHHAQDVKKFFTEDLKLGVDLVPVLFGEPL